MVQGGGLSTGKSGFTINTRGRLDCATFFVLHGGHHRGSSSSGLLHGEVSMATEESPSGSLGSTSQVKPPGVPGGSTPRRMESPFVVGCCVVSRI